MRRALCRGVSALVRAVWWARARRGCPFSLLIVDIDLRPDVGPLIEPLRIVDVHVHATMRKTEAGAPAVVPIGAVKRDPTNDVLHPGDIGHMPCLAAGRAGHGLDRIFAVDRERAGRCIKAIFASRDGRMIHWHIAFIGLELLRREVDIDAPCPDRWRPVWRASQLGAGSELVACVLRSLAP